MWTTRRIILLAGLTAGVGTTFGCSIERGQATTDGEIAQRDPGSEDADAPTVVLTTLFLPVGVAGDNYSATIEAGGGSSPSFAVTAGALPDGLRLEPDGRVAGVISEDAAGPHSVTIQARTSFGARDQRDFVLYVNPAGVAPLTLDSRLTDAFQLSPYSGGVRAMGGAKPYRFRIEGGRVPAGLIEGPTRGSFETTGAIFGTPQLGTAEASPYVFVVSASDAGGAYGIEAFTIVVRSAPCTIEQPSPHVMSVDEGSSRSGPFNAIRLSAADPDAPPASLSWRALQPEHGVAVLKSGSPSSSGETVVFAYEPPAGFTGDDSFSIEVDDGTGNRDTIDVEVAVGGHAHAFSFGLLNGGQPVGTGEAHERRLGDVFALGNADGSVYYSARSENLGRYLGRLSRTGAWEIWSEGFVSDPNTTPLSIEGFYNAYGRMDLVPHPTIPGGFFGLANQTLRVAEDLLDIHGHPTEVTFDGTTWSSWRGDSEVPSKPLIYSYGGNGDRHAAFAFDRTSGTGLATGLIASSGELSQLTAVRVDLSDPQTRWRRWHRDPGEPGDWHTDAEWSGEVRRKLVLDAEVDLTRYRFAATRVAHVQGSDDYLITFLLRDGASPTWKLGSARYREDDGFTWWDGGTWQPASETGYTDRIASLIPSLSGKAEVELLGLPGGEVLIVISDQGKIHVRSYDPGAETFTPVVQLASGITPVARLAPSGEVWIAYVSDEIRVNARRRLNGAWTNEELLFATGAPLTVEAMAFSLGRPILFVGQAIDAEHFDLFAIGDAPDTVWSHERPLVFTSPPPAQRLPAGELRFEKAVENTAPDMPYGPAAPLGLAADDDGYVYAARHVTTGLAVHPPEASSSSDNHAWGLFWDHLLFPGAVAVDPDRDRVFVTHRLIGGGAGALTTTGVISVWEMSLRRDGNYGWRVRGGAVPPHFDVAYTPQTVEADLAWGTGLAVDRSAGRLYATSALTDEILVYDVENVVDLDTPFNRSVTERRIHPRNLDAVRAIVDDLVLTNILGERSGGSRLVWISTDWQQVEDFVTGHPSYESIGTARDDTDLVRNLMASFKSRRDQPVLLTRYRNPGRGPGQLRFPNAISVGPSGDVYVLDGLNHRVQRLRYTEGGTFTFVRSIGRLGRGDGELRYPTTLSVTDGGVFVGDPSNRRIVVFDRNGTFRYAFGSYFDGREDVPLQGALGVYAGRPGHLYLGNANHVVTFTEE